MGISVHGRLNLRYPLLECHPRCDLPAELVDLLVPPSHLSKPFCADDGGVQFLWVLSIVGIPAKPIRFG